MELHWTIYVGVALLATAQWTAAQHEGEGLVALFSKTSVVEILGFYTCPK